jgi:hypothetical protein
MANGIGEDSQLANVVLKSAVAVFFPDPPENLYQLRQWYAAFEALNERVGVTIITQDSRTAAAARAETSVPVVVAALTKTVGSLLADGAVRVVLYVGQANTNAVALRSASVLHVFLNHGDSDKFVSVSNQVKGFDFAFVAGEAGRDRHAAGLMMYDAAARVRVVGRPQLPAKALPDGPLTVLYAPTWVGTQVVNAYSSVVAFGERLVTALLADPELHVVYRPHPRTGASDRNFANADARIRALVAGAPTRATLDTDPDPSRAFARSHVMIADVSAIATDWLAQSRALVSTVPAEARARVAAPARLYAETPRVDAETAGDAARIVRDAMADPAMPTTIGGLAEYYLGGLDAAGALEAFIAQCEELVTLCNAERARLEALS